MRIFLSMMLVLTATISAAAQSNGVVVGGKWADQVSISDVNGRPFEKKYEDVNGHPYFDTAWKYANIKLTQGKTFVNVKMRVNLAEQVTVFIASNGVEAFIAQGAVQEIHYVDTSAAGTRPYTFQTGFPAVDKLTQANFYQVLSAGPCTLLKSITKSIAEKKSEMSGEVSRDMETSETYYLFANGTMSRLKKDKNFILAALADKRELMEQFIESNKPSYKNTGDLVKLFSYYNSLN